jgi:hypothetical protein
MFQFEKHNVTRTNEKISERMSNELRAKILDNAYACVLRD